ncbi:MAG TPA: hypothetical protein VF530_15550 [Planctomycetota bacterium]
MAKRKKSKGKRSTQPRKSGTKRRAKGAAGAQALLPEQSQLFTTPAASPGSSLEPAPALPERKKGPTRGGKPTTSTHELLAEVPTPRRPAVAAPRAKTPAPRPAPKAAPRPAPDAPMSMAQIYETLAALLVPYARRMESEMHPKIGFCLKAKNARTGRETHFGAVQALPDGVAYHLFPLYGHPDLLSGVSPELANKLRGQTCFHFDSLHAGLVAELAQLTNAGFERFLTDGVF